MVKVKATAIDPRHRIASPMQNNNFDNIPQISSRSTRGFAKSITIQAAAGLLIIIAVGAAIAVPLSLSLTASQTSTENTISTTVTTITTATIATTPTTATTTSVTTSTVSVTTTTITAVLTAYGPQVNFNPSTLSSAWSLCYSAVYSVAMYPNISSILSTCDKNKLLLGCRPVGNALLTLAAMGNRADVLYNTSAGNTVTHQANGVNWYFSMNVGNWNSWGFVLASDSVLRQNCDGNMITNPTYRLCWHMVGLSGGYRCGSTAGLDNSAIWEKVIYHAM